jgi:hypothetical protein
VGSVGAVTVLWLSVVAAPATAQLKDRGAKDNPIIKRYQGSVIIGYDFRKFNDYELLLGPVQRTEPGARTPSSLRKASTSKGR